MIFGFNTDIKHGDTVYHVQSEARQAEKLLQTQVFVRGRCIGKKATSFAEMMEQPGFSDEQMHEMLKTQHRGMLDGIREGKLEEMLHTGPATGSSLAINWTNADAVYAHSTVVMQFSVTENGSAVPGAQLTSRLSLTAEAPIYSQAVTDAQGKAEMKIFLDEAALAGAAILIQAKAGDRSATRKFNLRKA